MLLDGQLQTNRKKIETQRRELRSTSIVNDLSLPRQPPLTLPKFCTVRRVHVAIRQGLAGTGSNHAF